MALIFFHILDSLTSIDESSTFTDKVLPDLFNPEPAFICPAPENCSNVSDVLPTVIEPSVVRTKPESAFTVPCSIKVNAPDVTSEFSLKFDKEMMHRQRVQSRKRPERN